MEITEIKNRLKIATVLSHYNLKPGKHGMFCCPFHDDQTPSFKIYTKTNTFFCFGCDAAGDVIELIQLLDKCTKREAILKAQSLIVPSPVKKPKPKPEPPGKNFAKLFEEFKQNLIQSPKALDYLKSRKLNQEALEIGYNPGNIFDKLKHCIVFPLKDKQGNITSFYGRSILNNSDARHFYLQNRTGLYPCYPNPGTEILILTEAVIDAATLLQSLENTSVLACYGTNGLTDEHEQAIKELQNLQEIIFFFDGDQAGTEGIKRLAPELKIENKKLKISYIETPKNEDINSLAQGHEPGIFTYLLESRKDFFLLNETNENKEQGTKSKENPEIIGTSAHWHIGKLNTQTPIPSEPTLIETLAHRQTGTLNTSNPYRIEYVTDTAYYIVKGGIGKQLDSLRVSLDIAPNPEQNPSGLKYRTKVDLYEDKQVQKLSHEAAEKLGLRADLLEMNLNRFTDLLEQYRDKELTTKGDDLNMNGTKLIAMTWNEREHAESILRKPNLVNHIGELLGQAGIVGEEKNRIFLFITAISHITPETLHVLIQGSSGSGKTRQLRTIADCMPPEKVVRLTRVSDKSFYNYPENYLKNKLVCLEDVDGLTEESEFAYRELVSNGELISSTSIKEENGNITAGQKIVRGPIASMACTTNGSLYEDNISRMFIVAVDESKEQTLKVIAYQNAKSAGKAP